MTTGQWDHTLSGFCCITNYPKVQRLKTTTTLLSGIPPFVALCFIVLCRHCDIYKLKVYGNAVSGETVGGIFPAAFVHIMILCHILVILTIAIIQTLSLLYFLW